MNTTEIGDYAEELAKEYLERHGYLIIKQKYKYKDLGEVDIIAQIDDTLVFVEVRHRTSTVYGTPEASLTPRKLSRIRRTALMWLTVHRRHGEPCRFDVIAVDLVGGHPVLRHLQGCF